MASVQTDQPSADIFNQKSLQDQLEALDRISAEQWGPQQPLRDEFLFKRTRQLHSTLDEVVAQSQKDQRPLRISISIDQTVLEQLKTKAKFYENKPLAHNLAQVAEQVERIHWQQEIQQQTQQANQVLQPQLAATQAVIQAELPARLESLQALCKQAKELGALSLSKQAAAFDHKIDFCDVEIRVLRRLSAECNSTLDRKNSPQQNLAKLQHLRQLFQGQMGRSLDEKLTLLENEHLEELAARLEEAVSNSATTSGALWEDSQSLQLLDVALGLLRRARPEQYTRYINQLLDARRQYCKLNFQETVALVQRDRQLSIARKLAIVLLWLRRSCDQERSIFQNTHLDAQKIEEVLDAVFERPLLKSLMAVLTDLAKQIALPQSVAVTPASGQLQLALETVCVLMSEQVERLDPTQLESLREGVLKTFAECADDYLQRVKQRLGTHGANIFPQLSLYARVISRLFAAVASGTPKLQGYVRQRIFLYSITRLIPSTTRAGSFEQQVPLENRTVLLNYYTEIEPLGLAADGSSELIAERIKFLETFI